MPVNRCDVCESICLSTFISPRCESHRPHIHPYWMLFLVVHFFHCLSSNIDGQNEVLGYGGFSRAFGLVGLLFDCISSRSCFDWSLAINRTYTAVSGVPVQSQWSGQHTEGQTAIHSAQLQSKTGPTYSLPSKVNWIVWQISNADEG